jgi:hypothetical protein
VSPITAKFALSLNNGSQHVSRLTLTRVQVRLKRMHAKAFQDYGTLRVCVEDIYLTCNMAWGNSEQKKTQRIRSYFPRRCTQVAQSLPLLQRFLYSSSFMTGYTGGIL